uniref:protein crumbs homolog 2a n=1 Tax=Doryrhamphus excisus TaxID=161450 RepID=UPI0025ADE035|nr:protein crumbs homolog 2a [Doryrhamphus excisus]
MELESIYLDLKTLLLTMMMFKWGILCTATPDKCLSTPCQNGATCVDTKDDYACICSTEGLRYVGKNCDKLYDACSFAPCKDCISTPGMPEYRCMEEVDECQSNPCSEPHSLCVDQLNGYFCRCPAGYGGPQCHRRVNDCVRQPCMNNGTCVLRPQGSECQCVPGYEGKMCEDDINECSSEPCQNGAICIDGVAEFHCFCVPGFQGHKCEIDINECASRPCANSATCINEKDHYACECLVGFTGINCESEIDECESDPCHNGATCHDLMGSYSCECPPGFQGVHCEADVDECESQPCLNGAACRDMVNSYECDCSDTGFEGDHCEVDVAECVSHPCQHGATCLEGVKQYTCLCWPGYEGTHCEMDIDECAEHPCDNGGECYERSKLTHWGLDWEPSYASVAGYICHCSPGFAGENCTVNIDECESGPCQNGGTCQDQDNGYACTCPVGFSGFLCEVNIDECESQPCQNGGWCEDGTASYICHCPEAKVGNLPWGGSECNVKLFGCFHHECQNGATCSPWFDGVGHGHTCLCAPGFYDEQCLTQTTFSFSSPGFIPIEVPQEKIQMGVEYGDDYGLAIQLRFRTTLPDMLVFYRGDLETYLLLEIVNGSLQVKAFSDGFELKLTSPDFVNDGDWRDVHVFENSKGLHLLLKGPGCNGDGCRAQIESPFQNLDSLFHVYVGGAPEELLQNSVSYESFIGCMEDLIIDSGPVLPQTFQEDQHLGCSKTEWCEPDPCHGRGRCVDLWTSYHCDCHRPFYSGSCEEELPSWTYSHEDSRSFSVYRIAKSHGRNFQVSFFLRSLKLEGLIFQLRTPAGEVYFSMYLKMGRLLISSLGDGAPLTAPIFLTTGEKHFLLVEIQPRQVIFDHGSLRYGIGTIPEVVINAGDEAYLGGLPEEWDSRPWGGHYKGCLQDFRLDLVHLEVDAWNDADEEEIYVSSGAENVKRGCISDDTCKGSPCQNGGECTVTFNDFTCSCPHDYTGLTCQTQVWCVSDPCLNGGHCMDLSDGYECLHNATFDNSPAQFSTGGSLVEPVSLIYVELRTRSENAVLLRATRGSDQLTVGLLDSSVWVEIHIADGAETLTFTGERKVADGRWHRVNVTMAKRDQKSSPWTITVDGIIDASSLPHGTGSLHFLNDRGAVLTLAESFTGCLGAIRVGGVYLPFVDDYDPPQVAQFRFSGTQRISLGCRSAPVCNANPCLNGATCNDVFNKVFCECDVGWEGELCDVDADDCASGPCFNGRCKDYLAGFECRCHPGYAGALCDVDVDECEHHACQHGAICQDGPNMYTCICPNGYSGPRCQWDYPPLKCGKDVLCANDGICNDGLWGANCTCMPGFEGKSCEMEINECNSNPCRHGGSCLDRFNMFVCQCPPGYSGSVCDINQQARAEEVSWLAVALPLLSFCVLVFIPALGFMIRTTRKKRQSEGAYSPSAEELAGARLAMDRMLKVPPEERLI